MVIDLDNADGFKLTWLHIPACCSRIGINTPVISAIAIHGNCKVSSDYLNNTYNLSVIRFDKDAREDGIYSNSHAKTILPAELSDCGLLDIKFDTDVIKAEHFGVQGSVKAITLPNGIKNISDNTFDGWGIERITIPGTVEKIGSNVFMDCMKLKYVVFEGQPQKFGCELFDGCNSLERIEINGEKLTVSDFISKYEDKVAESELPVTALEEISEEADTCEEFAGDSFDEEISENTFEGISVSFADGLDVFLPDDYICSVDADVIGENRALVAVLNDENADLSNPYESTESITVLYGNNVSSIDEADSTAESIGIVGGKIVTDNDRLNIRYELKENGEDLTIYLALICTENRSFPAQFFFNHSGTNKDELIERILASVSCASMKVPIEREDKPVQKENTSKAARGSETAQVNKYQTLTTSNNILDGVLYCPGEEPDRIHSRIQRLCEKLDEAYPDKVIVGLHKDHKKWGETVTELYRQLGYPDGNSFLNAYGYTIGTGVSGRPLSDPIEVVDELKRRYIDGATCAKMADLAAENPDLAPKFKNLQNQADKFFGMTLVKYFVREGILVGKTDDQCGDEFEALMSRYTRIPFTGTLLELKSANDDIDWNAVNRYYSQSGTTDSFKVFLMNQGILAEQEVSFDGKLAEITEELKKRYPEGKEFSGSIEQLKFDNRDLSVSSLNTWAMQVHKETARDYLVRVGIMEAPKSVEDIAEMESVSITAVYYSISAAEKNILRYLAKHT